MTNQKILQKNKNYQFYILTGAYLRNIDLINFESHQVFYCPYDSFEFKEILSELEGFSEIFAEEDKYLRYLKFAELSFVLYSENKDKLLDIIYFLQLIQPSYLYLFFDFNANFISHDDYPHKGMKYEAHEHSGYGRWFDHHQLQEKLFEDDDINLFYLSERDVPFVNLLLKNYLSKERPSDFEKLRNIYLQAFQEERKYIKYIFLIMILESLNISDDNQAITYKLSRMCAVLVGTTLEECKTIFERMKKVYRVRSKYLHSAKYTLHEGNYLRYVHSLVCELLIFMIATNFKIEGTKYFDLTTEMGFGQRNSLFEDKGFKSYEHLLKNEMNLVPGVLKEKRVPNQQSKKK